MAGTCERPSTGEVHVPAGTFWMGCNANRDPICSSQPNENAQHLVALSAYLIDQTEVTAAAYEACVDAGWCSVPADFGGDDRTYGDADKQDHPVNNVDWDDAHAFCQWPGKQAGVQRLCTEAEWERAARGGCETVVGDCATGMRTYPWGESPVTCALANKDCGVSTRAVGSTPAGDSPYGCSDMAGNVIEWVADYYGGAYSAEQATDPVGPANGTQRILRGGDFTDAMPIDTRATFRVPVQPETLGAALGFRCCSDGE